MTTPKNEAPRVFDLVGIRQRYEAEIPPEEATHRMNSAHDEWRADKNPGTALAALLSYVNEPLVGGGGHFPGNEYYSEITATVVYGLLDEVERLKAKRYDRFAFARWGGYGEEE